MKYMKEQLELLVELALKKKASDIHLLAHDEILDISCRISTGFIQFKQDLYHPDFLEYLRFISGMDLTSRWKPQSGKFLVELEERKVVCRYSWIHRNNLTTAVIRLLPHCEDFPLERLTQNRKHLEELLELMKTEHGLIVFCGPTGSGKTTTLHTLLHQEAQKHTRKIVSLEDPIEIENPEILQLEVSEEQGFGYEQGIEELLRHDPDIILIGECRNARTAASALRASLTGHLVLTSIHAGDVLEAFHRLMDFGCSRAEIETVWQGLVNQRLVTNASGKECKYEIWNRKKLEQLFEHGYSMDHPEKLDDPKDPVQEG